MALTKSENDTHLRARLQENISFRICSIILKFYIATYLTHELLSLQSIDIKVDMWKIYEYVNIHLHACDMGQHVSAVAQKLKKKERKNERTPYKF